MFHISATRSSCWSCSIKLWIMVILLLVVNFLFLRVTSFIGGVMLAISLRRWMWLLWIALVVSLVWFIRAWATFAEWFYVFLLKGNSSLGCWWYKYILLLLCRLLLLFRAFYVQLLLLNFLWFYKFFTLLSSYSIVINATIFLIILILSC